MLRMKEILRRAVLAVCALSLSVPSFAADLHAAPVLERSGVHSITYSEYVEFGKAGLGELLAPLPGGRLDFRRDEAYVAEGAGAGLLGSNFATMLLMAGVVAGAVVIADDVSSGSGGGGGVRSDTDLACFGADPGQIFDADNSACEAPDSTVECQALHRLINPDDEGAYVYNAATGECVIDTGNIDQKADTDTECRTANGNNIYDTREGRCEPPDNDDECGRLRGEGFIYNPNANSGAGACEMGALRSDARCRTEDPNYVLDSATGDCRAPQTTGECMRLNPGQNQIIYAGEPEGTPGGSCRVAANNEECLKIDTGYIYDGGCEKPDTNEECVELLDEGFIYDSSDEQCELAPSGDGPCKAASNNEEIYDTGSRRCEKPDTFGECQRLDATFIYDSSNPNNPCRVPATTEECQDIDPKNILQNNSCERPNSNTECQMINAGHIYDSTGNGGQGECRAPTNNTECVDLRGAGYIFNNGACQIMENPTTDDECKAINAGHIYDTDSGLCEEPNNTRECVRLNGAGQVFMGGSCIPDPGSTADPTTDTACHAANTGHIFDGNAGECQAPNTDEECRRVLPAGTGTGRIYDGATCRTPENTAECRRLPAGAGHIYDGAMCRTPNSDATCQMFNEQHIFINNACTPATNNTQCLRVNLGYIFDGTSNECEAPDSTPECASLRGAGYVYNNNRCERAAASVTDAACMAETTGHIFDTVNGRCEAPNTDEECQRINSAHIYDNPNCEAPDSTSECVRLSGVGHILVNNQCVRATDTTCRMANSAHILDSGSGNCEAPDTNDECARSNSATPIYDSTLLQCRARNSDTECQQINPGFIIDNGNCEAPNDDAECARLRGPGYTHDGSTCVPPATGGVSTHAACERNSDSKQQILNPVNGQCEEADSLADCGFLRSGQGRPNQFIYVSSAPSGEQCQCPAGQRETGASKTGSVAVAGNGLCERIPLTSDDDCLRESRTDGARNQFHTGNNDVERSVACRLPENTAECQDLELDDGTGTNTNIDVADWVYRTDGSGGRECDVPLTFDDCQGRGTAMIPNYARGGSTDCVNSGAATVQAALLAACNADTANVDQLRRQVFTRPSFDTTFTYQNFFSFPSRYTMSNVIGRLGSNLGHLLYKDPNEGNMWRRAVLNNNPQGGVVNLEAQNQWQYQGGTGSGVPTRYIPPGAILALVNTAQANNGNDRLSQTDVNGMDPMYFRVYLRGREGSINSEQYIGPPGGARLNPFRFDTDVFNPAFYALIPTDENGRATGSDSGGTNLQCAAAGSGDDTNDPIGKDNGGEFFILQNEPVPNGPLNGKDQYRLTRELSRDNIRFRESGGGMLNNAPFKVGDISFSMNPISRDMHMEYRYAFSETEIFKGGAYSGVRRSDNGGTHMYYHKTAAEIAPAENWSIYASAMQGFIRSTRYADTSLLGFSAGVHREGWLRHDDSYHVRLHSPFSATESRIWELSADIAFGVSESRWRLGVYRRLRMREGEEQKGVRLFYRREL